MKVKKTGCVLFLVYIIAAGLWQMMQWWDALSLLVILCISLSVWIVYSGAMRRWDFFAKNIPIFAGCGYGVFWAVLLLRQGYPLQTCKIAGIPVGYGFCISLFANWLYERSLKHDGTA